MVVVCGCGCVGGGGAAQVSVCVCVCMHACVHVLCMRVHGVLGEHGGACEREQWWCGWVDGRKRGQAGLDGVDGLGAGPLVTHSAVSAALFPSTCVHPPTPHLWPIGNPKC